MVAMQSGWMRRRETWFDALPSYEVVSLRRRPTDARTLLAVLDAIREKQEIGIDYQSMTGSPQSWRKVAPHALTYSAGRWYVRVWSREHNDFRDYNLSRIRSVDSKSPADVDYSLDYEWHQKIDLIVAPNPQLSTASGRQRIQHGGQSDRSAHSLEPQFLSDERTQSGCRARRARPRETADRPD